MSCWRRCSCRARSAGPSTAALSGCRNHQPVGPSCCWPTRRSARSISRPQGGESGARGVAALHALPLRAAAHHAHQGCRRLPDHTCYGCRGHQSRVDAHRHRGAIRLNQTDLLPSLEEDGRVEDSVAARRGALAIGLLLGAGVSVALGVYGRVHVPTYEGLPSFGFSSTATFKAWLGRVHRTTGFVAFALSLPVAAYCLYGFGFAPAPLSARTLVHSIAGCAFYGAFAAKVLFVHTRGISRWALPAAGALL